MTPPFVSSPLSTAPSAYQRDCGKGVGTAGAVPLPRVTSLSGAVESSRCRSIGGRSADGGHDGRTTSAAAADRCCNASSLYLTLENLANKLSERQILFTGLRGQGIVNLVLDFYGDPFSHAACLAHAIRTRSLSALGNSAHFPTRNDPRNWG
jgi:hypothetical protein